MSQTSITATPDIHSLTTEDDTPVDNMPSEKQQRLLTEALYSSWTPSTGQPFLVAANVGIFAQVRNPAIVPDVFLSLDVEVAEDWWQKEHRSYLLWEFGKPPEVVIEIVSNREGDENAGKLQKYARMRVQYYAIYDPLRQVMPEVLTIYRLNGMHYERYASQQFPELSLSLALWEGTYEDKHTTWLRWADAEGAIIPTGKERAEHERQRAEHERQRAEHERQRAEHERQRADEEAQRAERERLVREETSRQLATEQQRAERLAAMLRQLGHDPDQV